MELVFCISDETFSSIFSDAYSTSVESLEQWEECLSLLTLNSYWRAVYEPKLFSCAIIKCWVDNGIVQARSNIPYIIANHLQYHVRSVIIYALDLVHIDSNGDDIYDCLGHFLSLWLDKTTHAKMPLDVMDGLSGRVARILEPLYLRMPNLSQVFLQTDDKRGLSIGSQNVLLTYATAYSRNTPDMPIGDRESYIQQVTLQRLIMHSVFLNSFNFDEQQPMQLRAELFDAISMFPLSYTDILSTPLGNQFLFINYSNLLPLQSHKPIGSTRHVVCRPGVKLTSSNGEKLMFDTFRFVRTNEDIAMNMQVWLS